LALRNAGSRRVTEAQVDRCYEEMEYEEHRLKQFQQAFDDIREASVYVNNAIFLLRGVEATPK
jgi:hypothetical protein